MRRRLRDFPAHDEFQAMYWHAYDHTLWDEHIVRVTRTIEIVREFAEENGLVFRSAADLSCGDATVLKGLADLVTGTTYLGDVVSSAELTFTGTIEDTIKELEPVNLFVCTETLEHLVDPQRTLAEIRAKTDWLVLSTPNTDNGHENGEHIWEWDADGVEELLIFAGFTNRRLTEIVCDYYTYQVWICS